MGKRAAVGLIVMMFALAGCGGGEVSAAIHDAGQVGGEQLSHDEAQDALNQAKTWHDSPAIGAMLSAYKTHKEAVQDELTKVGETSGCASVDYRNKYGAWPTNVSEAEQAVSDAVDNHTVGLFAPTDTQVLLAADELAADTNDPNASVTPEVLGFGCAVHDAVEKASPQ